MRGTIAPVGIDYHSNVDHIGRRSSTVKIPVFHHLSGLSSIQAHHASMHTEAYYVGVFALLCGLSSAVKPLVQLDYTSYQGVPLPNGVTQWLGVRYAAPPVGDLRFREPQAPLQMNGTQPADAHGPICLVSRRQDICLDRTY